MTGAILNKKERVSQIGTSSFFIISSQKLSLFLRHGELHEIGLDEAVEFAVHDAFYVAGLEIGAVVLHRSRAMARSLFLGWSRVSVFSMSISSSSPVSGSVYQ